MVRVYVERKDLPDDLRHLLDVNASAAECTPPLDVFETEPLPSGDPLLELDNILLTPHSLSECPNCHEKKMPHRVCPKCGHYKGREVLDTEKAS